MIEGHFHQECKALEINVNIKQNPEFASRLCSKMDFCGAFAQDVKGGLCSYGRLHFDLFNSKSKMWKIIIPINLALATKTKIGEYIFSIRKKIIDNK